MSAAAAGTALTDTRVVRRRRLVLLGTAALLVLVDLAVKAAAQHGLNDGRAVDLGVLELRLAYNPGVAFSLGANLPSWLVLAVTGVITVGLAVYAIRVAATFTLAARLALSAVLAGAVGNLLDRARDGTVTDYLHTGWFPTFNLADVLISCGAATLVLVALMAPAHSEATEPRSGRRGEPVEPEPPQG